MGKNFPQGKYAFANPSFRKKIPQRKYPFLGKIIQRTYWKVKTKEAKICPSKNISQSKRKKPLRKWFPSENPLSPPKQNKTWEKYASVKKILQGEYPPMEMTLKIKSPKK